MLIHRGKMKCFPKYLSLLGVIIFRLGAFPSTEFAIHTQIEQEELMSFEIVTAEVSI